MIREYKPTGFSSWHQYYEHKQNRENLKQEVRGSLTTVCYIVLGSAFIFCLCWVGCFLDFISQH